MLNPYYHQTQYPLCLVTEILQSILLSTHNDDNNTNHIYLAPFQTQVQVQPYYNKRIKKRKNKHDFTTRKTITIIF